jgi:hypothetical protein
MFSSLSDDCSDERQWKKSVTRVQEKHWLLEEAVMQGVEL